MQDVDEEREMWLNSFYKAPLRLPMPSELEYWWENGSIYSFILAPQRTCFGLIKNNIVDSM